MNRYIPTRIVKKTQVPQGQQGQQGQNHCACDSDDDGIEAPEQYYPPTPPVIIRSPAPTPAPANVYPVQYNYIFTRQNQQGPIGSTGPPGLTGWTGSTGYMGYTGYIGQTGRSGTTGWTGPMGPTGFTGIRGSTGQKGTTGWTGRGATGITGQTGASSQVGVNIVTGTSYPTPSSNQYFFNTETEKLYQYTSNQWNLITDIPTELIANGLTNPSVAPTYSGSAFINTVSGQLYTYSSGWNSIINLYGNAILNGTSGPGLTGKVGDYFLNTTTQELYKKTNISTWTLVTSLGYLVTSGSVIPTIAPVANGAYYINTSTGQIFQYSTESSQWNVLLGGSRIVGSSYTNTLITDTIGTGATAIYEVGPVVTSASSKLLIVANLSLFTGTASANTYQMLVGRFTATGATAGSSTNIIANQEEIIMPYTSGSGASYFMASVNTSALEQAVNLSGTATDQPGAGTFYYRIWASASADNTANSTLTASLNIVQM